MILRSWKIGSAFGIDIFVNASFLLLPLWVFFSNLSIGPVAAALYLVFLTILIFGCIILHELGHALMARHFGIQTRDITLYPIGGVARLERLSEKPWEEFWISLAGPAVNIVIAIVLNGLMFLVRMPVWRVDTQFHIGFSSLAAHLVLLNFFLALFNLIPAFPMDGGRVLRALLALQLGRRAATELAAKLGLMFAMVFFPLAAYYFHAPGLVLLAIVVFFLGQQELWSLRRGDEQQPDEPEPGQDREERLEALHASNVFADAEALPTQPDFSGFTWDRKTRQWIEWREGRPIHVVSIE